MSIQVHFSRGFGWGCTWMASMLAGASSRSGGQSGFAQDPRQVMDRIIRILAAASLTALLVACGGEKDRDKDDAPADRERPSLGAPQDDDDGENGKEEKEDRSDENGDD